MLRRTLILPCLLAVAATGATAVAPATASAAPSAGACASAHILPTPGAIKRAQAITLCLLNRERAARGLRPLRGNRRLTAAATAHSRDMARRDYFSHVSPGGRTFVSRILAHRYAPRRGAWTLGENLAWGSGPLASPGSTVAAWMRSPGHRANILSRRFREIGVGIVPGTPVGPGGRGAVYTTDFGARG